MLLPPPFWVPDSIYSHFASSLYRSPDLLDRLADFLSALMEDNNQDLKWQTVLKAEVTENSFETVCKEYCLVLQELSSVS